MPGSASGADQYQRYAHAKQFRRPPGAPAPAHLLGRVIRDIGRKIDGNESLEGVFAPPLSLARRVKEQRQRERGRKVDALHAPEVECIGKGKADKPDEFGVRSRSLRRCSAAGAASSSPTCRRCRATPMTATRSPPCSRRSRRRSAPSLIGSSRMPATRATMPAGEALPGLCRGPKARALAGHQARLPAPRRRRAGDRAPQERAPHGPQPPRPPGRRRRQRRAGRRRLQFPPAAQVAGAFVRLHPGAARARSTSLITAAARLIGLLHMAYRGCRSSWMHEVR